MPSIASKRSRPDSLAVASAISGAIAFWRATSLTSSLRAKAVAGPRRNVTMIASSMIESPWLPVTPSRAFSMTSSALLSGHRIVRRNSIPPSVPLAPAKEIDFAPAAFQLLAVGDLISLGDEALEFGDRVVLILIGLVPEQHLRHRIPGGDEFDDEIAAEIVEPVDELAHRNIGGDDDVVNERKAQDQIGSAAFFKRFALGAAPALVRRGVAEIHDQRQDFPGAVAFFALVEPVDRLGVAVD